MGYENVASSLSNEICHNFAQSYGISLLRPPALNSPPANEFHHMAP